MVEDFCPRFIVLTKLHFNDNSVDFQQFELEIYILSEATVIFYCNDCIFLQQGTRVDNNCERVVCLCAALSVAYYYINSLKWVCAKSSVMYLLTENNGKQS